jgi:serine/threonine protein phosphatase PrpC
VALSYSIFSEKGKRSINQDAILSLKHNEVDIFAISDGVGGKLGGEIASSSAVKAVESILKNNPYQPIDDVYAHVHQTLKSIAAENIDLYKMATTLTICRVIGCHAEVGHVGDTRLYHLRGEGILLRTEDQTEVAELIRQNILTKERSRTYHRKNILLSAISPRKEYNLFTGAFEVRSRDRLILSTDGFHGTVYTKEISKINLESTDAKDLSENLLKLALSRNPSDNFSAICIELE